MNEIKINSPRNFELIAESSQFKKENDVYSEIDQKLNSLFQDYQDNKSHHLNKIDEISLLVDLYEATKNGNSPIGHKKAGDMRRNIEDLRLIFSSPHLNGDVQGGKSKDEQKVEKLIKRYEFRNHSTLNQKARKISLTVVDFYKLVRSIAKSGGYLASISLKNWQIRRIENQIKKLEKFDDVLTLKGAEAWEKRMTKSEKKEKLIKESYLLTRKLEKLNQKTTLRAIGRNLLLQKNNRLNLLKKLKSLETKIHIVQKFSKNTPQKTSLQKIKKMEKKINNIEIEHLKDKKFINSVDQFAHYVEKIDLLNQEINELQEVLKGNIQYIIPEKRPF